MSSSSAHQAVDANHSTQVFKLFKRIEPGKSKKIASLQAWFEQRINCTAVKVSVYKRADAATNAALRGSQVRLQALPAPNARKFLHRHGDEWQLL
jgi:hypothetical protein